MTRTSYLNINGCNRQRQRHAVLNARCGESKEGSTRLQELYGIFTRRLYTV